MIKTKDELLKTLNPNENGGWRSSDNRRILESFKLLSDELIRELQLFCLAGDWKVDITHLGMAWCCLTGDPKLDTTRKVFEHGVAKCKERIASLCPKRDAFDITRTEIELRDWAKGLTKLEEILK